MSAKKFTFIPMVTDNKIRDRIVDGYDTTGVSVFGKNTSQAVALVFAAFGDGRQVATLFAAARELLLAAEDISDQANPRPAVVGGKTHDYIVSRELIDTLRTAIKLVRSDK